MNSRLLFAVLTATLLAGTSAQAQGWDVSVMGGPTWSPHIEVGGLTQGMDTGYNLGGRLEYNLDDWLGTRGFSLAGDVFYNDSHFNAAPGHLSSLSFMGDVIYHLDTNLPFGVYGGAGVGAVRTAIRSPGVDDSGTVLGWQVLGGLDYPVSDNATMFAEYRYQNAHDADIGTVHGVGNTSNNLSVGVKFAL